MSETGENPRDIEATPEGVYEALNQMAALAIEARQLRGRASSIGWSALEAQRELRTPFLVLIAEGVEAFVKHMESGNIIEGEPTEFTANNFHIDFDMEAEYQGQYYGIQFLNEEVGTKLSVLGFDQFEVSPLPVPQTTS